MGTSPFILSLKDRFNGKTVEQISLEGTYGGHLVQCLVWKSAKAVSPRMGISQSLYADSLVILLFFWCIWTENIMFYFTNTDSVDGEIVRKLEWVGHMDHLSKTYPNDHRYLSYIVLWNGKIEVSQFFQLLQAL